MDPFVAADDAGQAGALLAGPATSGDAGDTPEYARVSVPYTGRYQRFRIKKKQYTQQYSHLYTKRDEQLRPVVRAAVLEKWGSVEGVLVNKINDLTTGTAIVIGTVFKDMQLKPSVLNEFSFERSGETPKELDNYVSPEDQIFLEDLSGRVCLIGDNLPIGTLVTGVVIAAKGVMNSQGELRVDDVCFPGLAPQPALKPAAPSAPYVLLVSGLDVGSTTDLLPFQLLQEYVGGLLGAPQEQLAVSGICRVIVCGNLVKQSEELLGDKTLSKKELDAIAEPTKTADVMLSQITAAVDTDLMPGEHDPANFTLPQQPFHPCMFPHSARFSGFHAVTNPYEADIGGVRFLGTSGQPLNDMRKYMAPVGSSGVRNVAGSLVAEASAAAKGKAAGGAGSGAGSGAAGAAAPEASPEEVDVDMVGEAKAPQREDLTHAQLSLADLARTLEWRHIAPTAPDTLGCYPFFTDDPFVVETSPHVYFAGNQKSFASKLVPVPGSDAKVRVITVPRFSTTSTAVLVNLRTLEARPIVFGAEDGDDL